MDNGRFDVSSRGAVEATFGSPLNHLGIRRDLHQIAVFGANGFAWQGSVGGVQLYGGAGRTWSFSVNHTPDPVGFAEKLAKSPNLSPNEITLRQGAALMTEVSRITHGTYNINEASLSDAFKLVSKYRIFVPVQTGDFLGQIYDQGTRALEQADAQRVALQKQLDAANLPAELLARPEFRNLQAVLAQPLNMNAVSVGQVRDAVRLLQNEIDVRGGAVGLTGTVVESTEDALKRLDAYLKDKAPDSKLTAEQKAELLNALKGAEAMVDTTAKWLDKIPSKEALDRAAKVARFIREYDPETRSSVYAAGAVVLPKTVDRNVVLAASGLAAAGIQLNADNVVLKRDPETNKLSASLHPTITHDKVVAIGVGSDVASAMPRYVADKLKLDLAKGDGMQWGAYAAIRDRHESYMGQHTTTRTAELGVQISHGLPNGHVAFGAVTAQKTDNDPTKVNVLVGRTI